MLFGGGRWGAGNAGDGMVVLDGGKLLRGAVRADERDGSHGDDGVVDGNARSNRSPAMGAAGQMLGRRRRGHIEAVERFNGIVPRFLKRH